MWAQRYIIARSCQLVQMLNTRGTRHAAISYQLSARPSSYIAATSYRLAAIYIYIYIAAISYRLAAISYRLAAIMCWDPPIPALWLWLARLSVAWMYSLEQRELEVLHSAPTVLRSYTQHPQYLHFLLSDSCPPRNAESESAVVGLPHRLPARNQPSLHRRAE
jgi:hypothetical protein